MNNKVKSNPFSVYIYRATCIDPMDIQNVV